MQKSSDEEALRCLVKRYADCVEYEMALFYSEPLVIASTSCDCRYCNPRIGAILPSMSTSSLLRGDLQNVLPFIRLTERKQ